MISLNVKVRSMHWFTYSVVNYPELQSIMAVVYEMLHPGLKSLELLGSSSQYEEMQFA